MFLNKGYLVLFSFLTFFHVTEKDPFVEKDVSENIDANFCNDEDQYDLFCDTDFNRLRLINFFNEPAQQKEPSSADSPNVVLIKPDWLEANLSKPNFRLIGLGQTKTQYDAAHIPNEVFVDWRTDITDPAQPDRYMLLRKSQFEALMGRLGITKDTTVVISDNISSRLSARMFWTLRYYGHKKIKLLDGGRKGWIQSGRSFVKEIPEIIPTTYKVDKIDESLHADLRHVRSHLEKKDSMIIDGRFPKQFSGEEPAKTYHTNKPHQRSGHVLNARNVPWPENFNDNGTFKSPEELRKLYDDAGFKTGNQVVTYCNEGLHAAPPWFVLSEILGIPNVRLYDASLAEWANRKDTPMKVKTKK